MKVCILGGGGIAAGLEDYLRDHAVYVFGKEACDVTDQYDIHRAVAPADWVINCAGIDDELNWKETIRVNLIGSMNVAKVCSHIPSIHIASVAGLHGKPEHPAYCASKAGVISLVQSYGFLQRIWAISPGRVDTPMREARYPQDTPGSRLEPQNIGVVVQDIFDDLYPSGSNIVIRKIGLDRIEIEEVRTPWKDELRVGLPVTI